MSEKIFPKVPVPKYEVVEQTSAGVDVGCVPPRRWVDHDGNEVEEEDGEDGEEVREGIVEHDPVEFEGVGAVVMPVEHVSVLHPVVSEYHVLRSVIEMSKL